MLNESLENIKISSLTCLEVHFKLSLKFVRKRLLLYQINKHVAYLNARTALRSVIKLDFSCK